MHVLKDIHRWLRPGGVLLDLHPEPEHPLVEASVHDRRVYLGRIDTASVIANIHLARQTLTSIVHEGWFAAERSTVFDFVSHFPSVDDWLRHREERRSKSIVDPAIVARARELLSHETPGELIVTERVLAATHLVCVDKPTDQHATLLRVDKRRCGQ